MTQDQKIIRAKVGLRAACRRRTAGRDHRPQCRARSAGLARQLRTSSRKEPRCLHRDDRGQGLCPPRYEHGNAADGHRPRSRRRCLRVSVLARPLCRCRRVARPGVPSGAAAAAGDRRCPARPVRGSPAPGAHPDNPAVAARPGQASSANTGRRRARLRNLRMGGRRIRPLFRDPLRRLRIAGDPYPGCAAAPDQARAVGRHGRGRPALPVLPAMSTAALALGWHPVIHESGGLGKFAEAGRVSISSPRCNRPLAAHRPAKGRERRPVVHRTRRLRDALS